MQLNFLIVGAQKAGTTALAAFLAEHPDTASTMSNLAALYLDEGRNAEAERLLAKAVDVRRRVLGAKHPDTLRGVTNLGLASVDLGKNPDAEALLRAALKSYDKVSPDSWERYNCESALGASILGQGRFEEAEQLLTDGYEGMVQRKATIPAASASAVAEAGRRIVRLYQSSGQREKVVQWEKALGLGRSRTR